MSRRNKVIWWVLAIVALVVLSRPIGELIFQPPDKGQSIEGHLNPERIKIVAPDELVKIINPQPASTVLDLGAGYGMFTFPLAKAVGGSGKVFATDVDSQPLKHLKREAEKNGLKNVIPVQVQENGLDPFYKKHIFDTVLACDVMPLMNSPETFFRELRAQMKKESGRLWIVDLQLGSPFTEADFADPAALRQALLAKGQDSPILRMLAPEVRQMLSSSSSDNGRLRQLVVRDLNRLLDDPAVWPEVKKAQWPLNTREAKVREYLAGLIEKKGVFASPAPPSDPRNRVPLRMLNRLVLQEMVQSTFWKDAFSLDFGKWEQSRPVLDWVLTGQDCIGPLGQAGFSLVKEHSGSPYYRIYEFKL